MENVFFVIGLFLLISALTIILTAVGGFAVSTAAQAGKPQNPVPPTPVAGISQNLRDELNTAFNPEFPFNFDSVGNPFADRTNISSAQFKTVSPTETGTKVPVLPTVNGIKNIQPSRPINGMPGYQPLPTPSPVPSPVQQVTAATPKTDVNEVARERNRLMRAGGDVGKIAELYSIDDLKPYGTVGTGNRNYVKFYVTSTKDRLTVGIGTRFRDGVIEGISDEGVKFKRSNGESVFSRWIRSTANEKNSATLRVSTNTP